MDDGCVSNFPREVVGERKEKWQGSRDRFIGTGGVIFLSHFCNDSGSDVTLGRSVGGVKRSEERREGMCSLGGRKIERAPRSLFLELNQTSVTTLFEYNISSNISAEGPRRIAAGLFQDTYLIPSRDLRPFRDFLLLLFFLFSFFARPPPRVPGSTSLSKSTLSCHRSRVPSTTLKTVPRGRKLLESSTMIVSLSKKKKKKETAQPNVSRSRSVDKHYPFTRSSLTDKPIIRHSTLTRPTILSITAAGPPRGQKEERDERCGESWCGGGDPNRGGATRGGSRKREGDAEREREKRSAGVPSEREL